jgi:hypothetical protein
MWHLGGEEIFDAGDIMISAAGFNSYSVPTDKEKPSSLIHSKYPPAVGMSEGIARRGRCSGRITEKPECMVRRLVASEK